MSSSYKALHNEIEFLKDILLKNGYPINFIYKQINKTLSKFFTSPVDTSSQSTSQSGIGISAPTEVRPVLFITYFLGSHSEKLSNDLKDLMSRYMPQLTLRIIYKSGCAIG